LIGIVGAMLEAEAEAVGALIGRAGAGELAVAVAAGTEIPICTVGVGADAVLVATPGKRRIAGVA